MNHSAANSVPSTDSAALIAAVRARIAAGLPVRRALGGRGRLHIDRPLPFLCAYRRPTGRADTGTVALVRGQASYLVAPGDPAQHTELGALVSAVVGALAESCGACLLLEIWAAERDAAAAARFCVRTRHAEELATTVEALAEALRAIELPLPHSVEVAIGGDAAPPGLPALISEETARDSGCLLIGLEVPALYRSDGGVLYPVLLRALTRELTNALQRGFFEFARVQTSAPPVHHHVLGRRRMVRAARRVDRALCGVAASFGFLLDVTPVNTKAAWEEFCEAGRRRAPTFHYRMLAVDPELTKRQLYALPIERLEDPVLALLLRDKRREIEIQLSMLEDRNTEDFLPGSLRLYGGVDDALFDHAIAILENVRPAAALAGEDHLNASDFALRARAELEHYRKLHPALGSKVQVRDDVPSLVVSHGDLLVPSQLNLAVARAEALIQHEVGTHIVSYANGQAQPLQVFAAGLADYEALQEGLAVFAEYVQGGLSADRLRLIAMRVVAVRRLLQGTAFPALVEELSDSFHCAPRAAFNVAMRVFRGGGLTKDAIYLRGLMQLLAHLGQGGALEPLLVGKISLSHVPLVQELLHRQLLAPPALWPRWLECDGAKARVERARAGLRPVDLIDEGARA